jgi:cytochrome c oxidase subunit 2
MNGPALAGQDDWYLAGQLKNFKAGLRGSHTEDEPGQQMRLAAGVLTDDSAIMHVVSYIQLFPMP